MPVLFIDRDRSLCRHLSCYGMILKRVQIYYKKVFTALTGPKKLAEPVKNLLNHRPLFCSASA